MITAPLRPSAARRIAFARIVVGILVVLILGYAYVVGIERNGASLFNYLGYFTNQTSLLTSVILITVGIATLRGRPVASWIVSMRAVATTCMLIVAVIYNVLVPGTGTAPAWVSVSLHVVFPVLVALDWVLIADRPAMPWRRLWIVLPYPALWLAVVLVRGVTDGWVPYGFLLPERGVISLLTHILALFAALLLAGSLVWASSRLPRPRAGSSHPSESVSEALR